MYKYCLEILQRIRNDLIKEILNDKEYIFLYIDQIK